MQTICFTTTARIRRPESKVVDLNEYRRKAESEAASLEASVADRPAEPRRKSRRRKLQEACLYLELSICACVLVLTLIAITQLFAA